MFINISSLFFRFSPIFFEWGEGGGEATRKTKIYALLFFNYAWIKSLSREILLSFKKIVLGYACIGKLKI